VDAEQYSTRERSAQSIYPAHEHLHPWVNDQSALEVDAIPQDPQAAGPNGSVFEQSDIDTGEISFTTQSNTIQDDLW
jgi:hypothetical protein